MKRTTTAALLLMLAGTSQAAQLTQADCNYADKSWQRIIADHVKHPEKMFSFAEKATYAYLEACEAAGMANIPMAYHPAPEATPEVQKFCAENARSRGESERCMVSGQLDEER